MKKAMVAFIDCINIYNKTKINFTLFSTICIFFPSLRIRSLTCQSSLPPFYLFLPSKLSCFLSILNEFISNKFSLLLWHPMIENLAGHRPVGHTKMTQSLKYACCWCLATSSPRGNHFSRDRVGIWPQMEPRVGTWAKQGQTKSFPVI